MNCAIIGFGKMGKIRAEHIEKCGGRIVGVYEPSNIACKYPIINSPELLIENDKTDAIFICSPNVYNSKYSIMGLSNGKHVFCEKPPALSSKELEEVIEVEKSSGKKLMYGFNHRHHKSIKKLKSILDTSEYGDIIWMRGRYGKDVDKSFINGWRSDSRVSGGGIFLDQGIHMLDLMVHLAGGFDEVYSMLTNTYWNIKGVEDNAFILLKNNQKQITASMHSTMANWRYMFSLEVFCKNGYAAINGFKTQSGSYGTEELTVSRNKNITNSPVKESSVFTFKEDDSWKSEIYSFFKSIKNNIKIENGNSQNAIDIMKLVDIIFEQNKESLYE